MQRIAIKCGRFYGTIPPSVNGLFNNYRKSVPIVRHSSTTLSTGSKTLSNNRDDKTIERTFLRRNAIQSTETKNFSQIESIKFFADENIIQMMFSNGRALNFNTFWLRDSCLCPLCVHPLTKTKLFDCADISTDLTVDRIDFSGDVVEIQWRDEPKEEHISQYSVSWLRLFDHVFDAHPDRAMDSSLVIKAPNDGLYASRVPKPDRILWDSTQINKQKMTISYKDFMDSHESVRRYLEIFCRFGVVFLEDVPLQKNSILSIARRMAYERITSYGSLFEIFSKPQTEAHIAYTGVHLHSHIDLPYRERSPGVQLLHCIEQASVGGASTLVDGIKCAETLRQTNPEYFKILAENRASFSFCDKETGIWFREKWPIIGLNEDQTIKELHYSFISMRPPLLSPDLINKFYESYRKLTELIRDERFVYRFLLKPGDLVMINNRTVLHGREQFDHLTQQRYLEGCYMDLDEVMALYEKLSA